MNEVYEDIRQIREQVTQLVSTCASNTTTLNTHTESLRNLNEQMKTALVPIQFFKWSLAVVTGLATFCGAIWGAIKGVAYAVTAIRLNHS